MGQRDCQTVALGDGTSGAARGVACAVRWRRSGCARRVSLRIDARAGAVVVTLPPRVGRGAGMALLVAEAAWVVERLAALAPAVALVPGATVPLGGVPHVIRVVPGAVGRVVAGAILVEGGPDFAHRTVELLRAEARSRIAALVEHHAAALAVRPRPCAVRLKDTRSRWGSCAPDGTLAFSWRLVMAPGWVLDYVVAHEVAHLREMNHSAGFWAHVAALTPHRNAAVAWLRANGPGLLRVG